MNKKLNTISFKLFLLVYVFLYQILPAYLLYEGAIYAGWVHKMRVLDKQKELARYLCQKLFKENPQLYQALRQGDVALRQGNEAYSNSIIKRKFEALIDSNIYQNIEEILDIYIKYIEMAEHWHRCFTEIHHLLAMAIHSPLHSINYLVIDGFGDYLLVAITN